MSRRGNCYDNAAMESFFESLKKEKIRHHIFKTREVARIEISDYIEVFYNRTRRQQHLGNISPAAYEQQMEKAVECPWKRSKFNSLLQAVRETGVGPGGMEARQH